MGHHEVNISPCPYCNGYPIPTKKDGKTYLSCKCHDIELTDIAHAYYVWMNYCENAREMERRIRNDIQ